MLENKEETNILASLLAKRMGTKKKQIKRIKFEGQYLYLSRDKARSAKQLEQRDQLSLQTRRIPVFISETIVIEILAEVIRQSKRHRANPCIGSKT